MEHVSLADGRRLQVTDGGDPDGALVVVHHGTPGGAVLDAAWERDAAGHGLHLVTYARPGYGESTRHRGRSVADVAEDVAALADAFGADRFLTWGSSGGGPHALACAALLPGRVVAAASLAGVAPYDAPDLDFLAGMGPGNIEEFGVVVEQGEAGIRTLAQREADGLLQATHEQLVAEMAPFVTEVDADELRGPFGKTLLDAIRSGLGTGVDGWVDDDLVFVKPWGFAVSDIGVPVLIWQGRQDAMVPYGHGEWLARQVRGADVHLTEDDGHLTLVTRRIPEVHGWLREKWDAAGPKAPARSPHEHGSPDPFDESFWEERYRSHAAVWSGKPNPQLVAETADLAPRLALDAGSGEGADALWLASRGWQVTAVDFSTVALQRGAAQAEALGADVAGRVDWRHADLTDWSPEVEQFDLVSAQFMQLPGAVREALFERLSAGVAPGGTLLIVGHHPSDMQTTIPRPPMPGLFFTAEEVADSLDPDRWEVLVADARPRRATDPDGQEVTIHDAVLRARKRR